MRSLSSDEFEPDTDVGSEGEVKELARNLQLWTLLQTVERYQAVYHRISEIALANSYFAKALLVTHAQCRKIQETSCWLFAMFLQTRRGRPSSKSMPDTDRHFAATHDDNG